MCDKNFALFVRQFVERVIQLFEQDGPRVNGVRACIERRQQIFKVQILAFFPGDCFVQRLRFLFSENRSMMRLRATR